MKTLFKFVLLLSAVFVISCKSTDPGTTSTHGVNPDGNVWMNPPPVGEGVQMAILPFDVPKDSEVQGNFYFDLPSSVDFTVGRIEIAMNQGTHHMNCFLSPLVWPKDSGEDQKMVMRWDDGKVDTQTVKFQKQFNATIVWNSSDMLVEAQIPYLNWVLPRLSSGEQTVVNLKAPDATHHMIIENHFVNIGDLKGTGSQTTPNGKGAVIINLWKAKTGPFIPSSMMIAKNTHIKIPPNSDVTFSKDCLFPGVSTYPIYVLGMTGHFHSRGRSFRVDKMTFLKDADGNFTTDVDPVPLEKVYQNSAWDEPPFKSYDPPIELKPYQFLRYTTQYVNPGPLTFNFGPHVATEEHCNLFSWFVPAYNGGQTVYDNN